MPPIDTQPQSVIRYLTRLLAALSLQAGGELRIPMEFVRKIEDESNRQALLEDTDTKKDELVLRFGTKHSAVYPVEPDLCDSPKLQSPTSNLKKLNNRPPMTLEELQKLERTIAAKKAAVILRSERQQQASSNPLELNFPDLER